jgi:hypothetical protein
MKIGAPDELPKIIQDYLNDYFDIIFDCDNWFSAGCAGEEIDETFPDLDKFGNAMRSRAIETEAINRGIKWKDLVDKKILLIDVWERDIGLSGPEKNSVETIYEICEKYGLQHSDIYYTNNDLNLESNLEAWSSWPDEKNENILYNSNLQHPIYKPKILLEYFKHENVKGLDWTSLMYYNITKDSQKFTTFNPNPTKFFMCLMGSGRIWRENLWDLFTKSKIINNGHVSYMDHGISLDGVMFPKGTETYDNSTLIPFFNDSFFSIIAENSIDTTVDFFRRKLVSEKTWRVIASGHPFIILGNRETLLYLRDRGFETFPELFDESYDEEISPHNRQRFVEHEILRVCAMDKTELEEICESIWWKVEHNRKHFYNEQTLIDYFKRDFYENL